MRREINDASAWTRGKVTAKNVLNEYGTSSEAASQET